MKTLKFIGAIILPPLAAYLLIIGVSAFFHFAPHAFEWATWIGANDPDNANLATAAWGIFTLLGWGVEMGIVCQNTKEMYLDKEDGGTCDFCLTHKSSTVKRGGADICEDCADKATELFC